MEDNVDSFNNSFTRICPFGELSASNALKTKDQIEKFIAVSHNFKYAAPLVSFDPVHRVMSTQIYGFEPNRIETEMASLPWPQPVPPQDSPLLEADKDKQGGTNETSADDYQAGDSSAHDIFSAHPEVRINKREKSGPYPVDLAYYVDQSLGPPPPLFTALRRALEIGQGMLELHDANIPVGDVIDSVVVLLGSENFPNEVAMVSKYGLLRPESSLTWDQLVIQDARSFGKFLGVLLFGQDSTERVLHSMSSPGLFLFESRVVVTADDLPFIQGLLSALINFPTKEGDPTHLFRDIIEEQFRPFLLKCAIADPLGYQFWVDSFGADCFSVPWCDFIPKMLEFLHVEYGFDNSLGSKVRRLTASEKELKCVRAVLTQDCSVQLDTTSAVTPDKFGRLCDLFGPFQISGDLFVNVVALMQEPWFHGEVSHEKTAAWVRETGDFLVRFSNSQRNKFTIATPNRLCRVARIVNVYGQVTYKPELPGEEYTKPFHSIVEVIAALKDHMRLFKPVSGSKFFDFFAQRLGYISNSSYIDDLLSS